MSHAKVPLNKASIKEINIGSNLRKMGKVKPVSSYATGAQPTKMPSTPKTSEQGGKKVAVK